MTYIPANEKIQVGRETVIGDGAAATIQLAGVSATITPRVEGAQLIDKQGDAMPAHQGYVTRRWTEVEITGNLWYDHAYLWLDGIFGADESDVRTYIAHLTQATAPKSLCLYYGQTGGIFKVPGIVPTSLEISWGQGGPVQFSYKGFGKPVVDGASFAALAYPDVDLVQDHHTDLYMDPLGTAVGTTQLTDLAFSGKAVIETGRAPVWHLGNQEWDAQRPGKWGGSYSLSVEANATLLGYLGDVIDNLVTPEAFAVRSRMTDGASTFDLDFAGQILTAPTLLPEVEGIVAVQFDLSPVYEAQAAFLSCWKASLDLP